MKTVLLAQSDEDKVRELKKLLEGEGIRVLTASTAEEALEAHRSEKADYLVADLDLPAMGGDGLCSAIRQDENLRRVYIALVCQGRKVDLQRCGRCGADSFFGSPINPQEVSERVVRLLEVPGRRAMRALMKVTVNSLYMSDSFFCTSRDISATGILLETEKTLAKGDTITCSFFLPDTERIVAKGSVVRIAKGDDGRYDYGVEFRDLEPGQRDTISTFVETERQKGNIY